MVWVRERERERVGVKSHARKLRTARAASPPTERQWCGEMQAQQVASTPRLLVDGLAECATARGEGSLRHDAKGVDDGWQGIDRDSG